MDDKDKEIMQLKKLVLQERIRRLSAERAAGEATMMLCQLRRPLIEAEAQNATLELKKLTEDAPHGPSSNQ